METVTVSKTLWDEIVDYFAEREDVRDGDDGVSQPNREMQIMTAIRHEGLED